MIIGVLKEPSFETRVSLLPEHLSFVKKMKVSVCVEEKAGAGVLASDESYREQGAEVCSRDEVIRRSDIILSIQPPAAAEISLLQGKVLLGMYQPLANPRRIIEWSAVPDLTVFSMEMLPRTTRAQVMDVLSSQANIAGYKAVLMAANLYPRYFPMFMTAAGSIPPARVLILGAGVAGLQAIATAKRLGAVVEVFDTRPAVKEEVMSLGAKFIEVEGAADSSGAGGYAVEQSAEFLQRQQARIAESAAKSDIIITTAQIPGKKAPVLITQAMIQSMRKGSVIIDLASATGGNTECTRDNETAFIHGVCIVGNSSIPCLMPSDASKLYGKNVLNFAQLLADSEGHLKLNFSDDLVKGTCIVHGGQVTQDRIIRDAALM
jgi:NAD(P) transhydrogenase subunit alpha